MRLTEQQLAGMVSELLGSPPELRTTQEIFEWAERHSEHLNTPFNLVTDVRVIHERLSIVSDALKPTNSCSILPYLNETTDPVLLGADNLRGGKEGLYFFALADHDMILQWVKQINGSNMTRVLIGAAHNRMVIAASFTSFLRTT